MFCIASLHQKPVTNTILGKIIPLYVTEQQLVVQCQKADPKAQRYLYEKFSGKMLAICKRYLAQSQQAEDAMIEGFVKIFNKIDTYKNEGSFEGWMKRIMVNEALMSLRANQKNMFMEDVSTASETEFSTSFEADIAAEELMNMIQKLPAGFRAVFNLYAIEGYSHQEIAKTLQITEGTSKSQLSRARVFLQNMLGKAGHVKNEYY